MTDTLPVITVGQPFILANAGNATLVLLAFVQDGHRFSLQAKEQVTPPTPKNYTLDAEPGGFGVKGESL
jgi:hypothetical protein